VTVGSSGRVSGEAVIAYHERTKHSYATVYGGGWSLDWDNQPNPFRRYDGAPRLELPPARSLPPALLPLRATGEVLRALGDAPPADGWRADGAATLSSLLWHAV